MDEDRGFKLMNTLCVDVFKKLVEASADVNAKPANYGGIPALVATTEHEHLDVARDLLEAGAQIELSCQESDGDPKRARKVG